MISFGYWKYRKIIFACFVSIIVMVIGVSALVMIGMSGSGSEPVPDPAPASFVEVITPEPTARPEVYPTLTESYKEWKFRHGGYSLGDAFTWRRDDVSGLKDLLVHATVYGYRIEPNYQWWSVSWGRYFSQVPTAGMKYLFVYVDVWMEGDNPTWDPRMYGYSWDHFAVQIGDQLYRPDESYLPPVRIRELEETWDHNNVTRIAPFGCLPLYDNGKESCAGEQWIRMGPENGLDGFIIFEIPKETAPEDIRVLGDFRGFGSAWWELADPKLV